MEPMGLAVWSLDILESRLFRVPEGFAVGPLGLAVLPLSIRVSEFSRMPEGFAVEPFGLAVGPLGHLFSELGMSECDSSFCVFQDFFQSYHLSLKLLSSQSWFEFQSFHPELGLGLCPHSLQAPEPELPPSWYQVVACCPTPLSLPLPFPLPLAAPFSHASLSL